MVACRSAPATTRTAGQPASPRRSTSHPASASTWWRAAARATVLAACPPVTNPDEADDGRPSRSFSQPPATSSTTAAPGDVVGLNAGWSQPVARIVGRGGRVEGAADDEAEVPRTGRGDERRLDRVGQLSHDLRGRGGPVGQRPQPLAEVVEVDVGGEHRPLGHLIPVVGGPHRRVDEEIAQGGHAPSSPGAAPAGREFDVGWV